MEIRLIIAIDSQSGIGKNNRIPWNNPADLAFFKRKTLNQAIVMGYNTFKSLPRVLPNRLHLVLSSKEHESTEDVKFFKDWDSLLHFCNPLSLDKHIYFIGGRSIFHKAFELNLTRVYITRQVLNFECDTHFLIDQYLTGFQLDKKIGEFETWTKPSHPEYNYLQCLNTILYQGSRRQTRNSITYSQFGKTLEFDIEHSFPLLTTKRMAIRSIVEELLWFIRGQTDSRILDSKGVKIWNGNSSRSALDAIGHTHRREGDCGEIYGFQWRHWGAEYKDCETDYTDQGYDQLAEVIHLLKTDPTSRRILFTGWNPDRLRNMCLPPCHVLYQFYVDEKNRLHCQMYQRSQDLFLGAPFNIASVALLVYLLSYYTYKTPGTIRICVGDMHIYETHVEAVKQQLTRTPIEWCQLRLVNMPDQIENVEYENLKFVNYQSHDAIRADMVV